MKSSQKDAVVEPQTMWSLDKNFTTELSCLKIVIVYLLQIATTLCSSLLLRAQLLRVSQLIMLLMDLWLQYLKLNLIFLVVMNGGWWILVKEYFSEKLLFMLKQVTAVQQKTNMPNTCIKKQLLLTFLSANNFNKQQIQKKFSKQILLNPLLMLTHCSYISISLNLNNAWIYFSTFKSAGKAFLFKTGDRTRQ